MRPGGIIVEGTAGNTGIGLALVANSKGYRTVIVIPDTQSEEKKDSRLHLWGLEQEKKTQSVKKTKVLVKVERKEDSDCGRRITKKKER